MDETTIYGYALKKYGKNFRTVAESLRDVNTDYPSSITIVLRDGRAFDIMKKEGGFVSLPAT